MLFLKAIFLQHSDAQYWKKAAVTRFLLQLQISTFETKKIEQIG